MLSGMGGIGGTSAQPSTIGQSLPAAGSGAVTSATSSTAITPGGTVGSSVNNAAPRTNEAVAANASATAPANASAVASAVSGPVSNPYPFAQGDSFQYAYAASRSSERVGKPLNKTTTSGTLVTTIGGMVSFGGQQLVDVKQVLSYTDADASQKTTAAGTTSCEYLAKHIGGKGNVVIINGPPVSSVIDRVKGCEQVLSKDGIKVLSDNQNAKGSRDGGLSVMQDLLTANPKIDGVFAINDPTAIGADLAIKQAHRDDIKLITAVDGSPDGQAGLKDKSSLFQATAAQNPYHMASLAIEEGYGLLQGKAPKEKILLLPVPLITKANVASYPGWVKQ